MYVVKVDPNHTGWGMLHELDKKGLKLAQLAYPNHKFKVVSGREAHRWVRYGMPHSTPLYIGPNGRIRYARDAR